MKFHHPDKAILTWAQLKLATMVKGADVAVVAGSKWEEKCPRPGCPETEHRPLWHDKVGDYVERCVKCNARWRSTQVRTLRQPGSRTPDKHRPLLSFHEIDRVLSPLGENEISIYVAYVYHPERVSGTLSALAWMRERGLRLVRGNYPKAVEQWIDQKRRETKELLVTAGMWSEPT